MTVALTTIRLRRRPRSGTVGASARRRDGQKILIPGVIRLTSTHQFPLLHEYSYFSRALRARFRARLKRPDCHKFLYPSRPALHYSLCFRDLFKRALSAALGASTNEVTAKCASGKPRECFASLRSAISATGAGSEKLPPPPPWSRPSSELPPCHSCRYGAGHHRL